VNVLLRVACLLTLLASAPAWSPYARGVLAQEAARKIDGYRGIWFTLGQVSAYGDKYSGGLGTYTAKHHPTAVYAPAVNKTFFVYGGTPAADARALLAMISYYDHARHRVPRPSVVHQKEGVLDPHDNASLNIDAAGYLWFFVSGRARARPGLVFCSTRPYDIDAFTLVREDEFAYPQPWWHPERGWLFLFTRYTDGRELYWATSSDGYTWSPPHKLASGGHYQMSNQSGGRVSTAFNVHLPATNVDARTNLYYLHTDDGGQTWQTVDGTTVTPPLAPLDTTALVRDYRREGRLVYLKDLGFDRDGHPVLLYLTSASPRPGPEGMPRSWTVAHWDGARWLFHEVTGALHNYDMGSLYLDADGTWRIIAPTEPGPQRWGTGGEMAMWTSPDEGRTWTKMRDLTAGSPRNHAYARRPLHAHPGFYAFWADGDPDAFSLSRLYFTDRSGEHVWRLPYTMEGDEAMPEPVDGPSPHR
jgi:hypothetical protein